MLILPEAPRDRDAIYALTQAAFEGNPHSEGTEGRITDALREAGALTLSLTAWEDGRLAGHIAFSPVTVGDGSRSAAGIVPQSVASATSARKWRRGRAAPLEEIQHGSAPGDTDEQCSARLAATPH